MLDTFNYPAEILRDEDGRFVVTFPDFGWGATDGTTREEALAEANLHSRDEGSPGHSPNTRRCAANGPTCSPRDGSVVFGGQPAVDATTNGVWRNQVYPIPVTGQC